MTPKTVWAVYFSGTGTTERTVRSVAGELARMLSVPCRSIDFTRPQARQKELSFCERDLVVFGTPVYAGRVPNVLLPYLREKVRGGGALAVPVVLFGNRNYDDALIELRDLLQADGFGCIAAGAFVGEHSFSRTLGAVAASIWHVFFYSGYKFWFKYIDMPFTNAVLGINYMHIYAISFIIMLVIIFVCAKIQPNDKIFDNSTQKNASYDMTPWVHKNAVAIWLVSFLVYEYFLFSPAGFATPDRNMGLIGGVTLALAAETVILYLMEKKKRVSTNACQTVNAEG